MVEAGGRVSQRLVICVGVLFRLGPQVTRLGGRRRRRALGRSGRCGTGVGTTDVPSLTVENYVKTIYLIAARRPEGVAVGTGEIAQALEVSPGTVTGMLKTLSEAELATYAPYEGAKLTAKGRHTALTVLRRHRLVELFLAQTLEMTWDEVHAEAEHLEHAASDRLIDRIDAFLGHPAVDPHGDPIPRADGSLAEPEGVPLKTLERGQTFRLVRVVDQDPTFLRYLTDCHLDLGTVAGLVENRPESGALVLSVGERVVALGAEAAGKLMVLPHHADSPRRR